MELYNQLTADRAAAGGPRSAVWKTIKETLDREFGFHSEEAYKSSLKRYLKRSATV